MSSSLSFAISRNSQPTPIAGRVQALENPGFGMVFTDHMAVVEWDSESGWHSARVSARAPFQIDPAASVLHYAQEIFEGMKAYRNAAGRIVLFRPENNASRFNASARRMAMPEIPQDLFIDAVAKLVAIDADWVPEADGASLYLRPFMFASETFLGVRAARKYIFCVIASPVGPYFKGGAKPISVWVSQDYARAAQGGTGTAKCGGNYAAGLVAQSEAYSHGCDQVVFLDAAQHRWVEELGGMNIFFIFIDGHIVTPELGTILPGITRDSLLILAREAGIATSERAYSFDEWKDDAANGRLSEVFACGTAAVVAPIGSVKFQGGQFQIGDGACGPVTQHLRDQLTGIQRGTFADRNGWLRPVC